jgi:hypothetical protein
LRAVRNKLDFVLDEVELKTALALGSWLAFLVLSETPHGTERRSALPN